MIKNKHKHISSLNDKNIKKYWSDIIAEVKILVYDERHIVLDSAHSVVTSHTTRSNVFHERFLLKRKNCKIYMQSQGL